MKTQIVKTAPTVGTAKRGRAKKDESVQSQITGFSKGDKVSFHPYRQKRTVRGTIISRVPSKYERKKTHEEMELVTIKTVKGEILTKTTAALKLLEKASV